MAGREMKNEYFALRDAPIPSTRASDIVDPDRERPGKTAAPCMIPMAAASQEGDPRLHRVVKGVPDDRGRYAGHDQQQKVPTPPRARAEIRIPPGKGARDVGDLPPQEKEYGQQRPQVQKDVERQFGFREPEHLLREQQVARDAHRQELGGPLEDSQQYRLEYRQRESVTRFRPGRFPRLFPSRRGSGLRFPGPFPRTGGRARVACSTPARAPILRRKGPARRPRRSPPGPAAGRSPPPSRRPATSSRP